MLFEIDIKKTDIPANTITLLCDVKQDKHLGIGHVIIKHY